VCISAADGAGGADVARLVADGLGYRLIDEVLIQRAAEAAEVDPAVVADVERRRSLLERLMTSVGSGADVAAFAMIGVPPEFVGDPEAGASLRELITTAIEEAAAEGSLVIYAHGGSVALAKREHVLRVLVTAPVEVRRHRLAEERSLDVNAAAKAITESDRGRADYLKRFYRVSAERPELYDVVVNTERLTAEAASALVVAAAAAPAPTQPTAV
jgi:cytidylate kinase